MTYAKSHSECRPESFEGQGTPTTLRFSRRLGESLRGADYAEAIEPWPGQHRGWSTGMFTLVVLFAGFCAVAVALLGPL